MVSYSTKLYYHFFRLDLYYKIALEFKKLNVILEEHSKKFILSKIERYTYEIYEKRSSK
jgi:hypothetical protein